MAWALHYWGTHWNKNINTSRRSEWLFLRIYSTLLSIWADDGTKLTWITHILSHLNRHITSLEPRLIYFNHRYHVSIFNYLRVMYIGIICIRKIDSCAFLKGWRKRLVIRICWKITWVPLLNVIGTSCNSCLLLWNSVPLWWSKRLKI